MSSQRITIAVAIALLGACTGTVVTSPASATTVARVSALAQGPQVVDGRIAWMESRCVRGCGFSDTGPVERSVIRLARAGERPRAIFEREVQNASSGPSFYFESFRFAISASHLALLKVVDSGGPEGESGSSRLNAMRRGGRFATLRECDYEPFLGGSPYALEGTLVAYDGSCSGGYVGGLDPRLMIRDLAAGTAVAVPEREGLTIEAVRVDAPHVAALLSSGVTAPAQIAVYTAGGDPVLRVPFPEQPEGFDVQADGTLVVCAGGELRSYAGSETQALGRCTGAVRATAGRIVYTAPDGGGTVLRLARIGAGSRDLAALGSVESTPFDADARHVTYGLATCDGNVELRLVSLATAPLRAPDPRCPVRVGARTLSPAAKGRVRVRLRCPRGCRGVLALKRKASLLATETFLKRPGRHSVTLTLGHKLRQTLRRRGALRVVQIARVKDRTGEDRRIVRSIRLVRR